MLVTKCDICGGITEEGPASMMLFKGYREDYSSWADCTELNVKKQVSNRGGKVWDICGGCLEKLRDYIEYMSKLATDVDVPNVQETEPEMKRLYAVKVPRIFAKDGVRLQTDALVKPILGGFDGSRWVPYEFESETDRVEYLVYTYEDELREACIEMKSQGIDVAWGEATPEYLSRWETEER